jgi:DNA-binding MarR family transcriptional regulator
MCDRMEAAGLLSRGRDATGSGAIVIFVTASGRRLAARIREQRRAVLDHVFQSLTPDGRASLARAVSEFAASPA